ncbi:uncharacterized protein LOC129745703 [Uranotaenia lowii]|uniref:uncharacterized protein LOC129745703 n=1 Tax=Uranotaenia lowii TaxID=190385 RepID=UPI00247A0060|nr:uncharacterized protein LOC129745703 [Uranotaenia lowii]
MISFHGNPGKSVGEIFSSNIFSKSNYRLILELFRVQKTLKIDVQEIKVNPYYVSRKENLFKGSKVLIMGDPGMGKTTEIAVEALKLIDENHDKLIILLDFPLLLPVYEKLNNSIYDAIVDTLKLEVTERLLVKQLISVGKICLLLDDLDEISDQSKNSRNKFLKDLEQLSLFKICVTSKPLKNDLIEAIRLGFNLNYLEPFDEEHQKVFLRKYFELALINNPSLIEFRIHQLVMHFKIIFSNKLVLGNPMKINMVGYINKDSIANACFVPNMYFHIGDILAKFVNCKFENRYNELYRANKNVKKDYSRMKNDFFENHISLANQLFVNSTPNENLAKGLEAYGLIKMLPTVGFIHKTYLDYFLSFKRFKNTNTNVDSQPLDGYTVFNDYLEILGALNLANSTLLRKITFPNDEGISYNDALYQVLQSQKKYNDNLLKLIFKPLDLKQT